MKALGTPVPYFEVDAFTSKPYGGNPAGVCLLDAFPPDEDMRDIAEENKHSETAFLVPDQHGFVVRWFTPGNTEIDLCGHATLAAAFVLFTERNYPGSRINFKTKDGEHLYAEWDSGTRTVSLDFPAWSSAPVVAPDALIQGLGRTPREVRLSRDYVAVFDTVDELDSLKPDFEKLRQLDCLGIIATARGRKGSDVDFALRFFEPRSDVNEDPVTGSAQCTLIPYWAGQLRRDRMKAEQRSKRGGTIFCEHRPDGRVGIGGHAVLYNRGEVFLQLRQ